MLTSASATSISLQWKSVDGNANVNYTVTWTPNHSSGSQTVMNKENKTTINDLMSNYEYSFQVQAENGGGPGEQSQPNSYFTSK